jgi:hypothetical protein
MDRPPRHGSISIPSGQELIVCGRERRRRQPLLNSTPQFDHDCEIPDSEESSPMESPSAMSLDDLENDVTTESVVNCSTTFSADVTAGETPITLVSGNCQEIEIQKNLSKVQDKVKDSVSSDKAEATTILEVSKSQLSETLSAPKQDVAPQGTAFKVHTTSNQDVSTIDGITMVKTTTSEYYESNYQPSSETQRSVSVDTRKALPEQIEYLRNTVSSDTTQFVPGEIPDSDGEGEDLSMEDIISAELPSSELDLSEEVSGVSKRSQEASGASKLNKTGTKLVDLPTSNPHKVVTKTPDLEHSYKVLREGQGVHGESTAPEPEPLPLTPEQNRLVSLLVERILYKTVLTHALRTYFSHANKFSKRNRLIFNPSVSHFSAHSPPIYLPIFSRTFHQLNFPPHQNATIPHHTLTQYHLSHQSRPKMTTNS